MDSRENVTRTRKISFKLMMMMMIKLLKIPEGSAYGKSSNLSTK